MENAKTKWGLCADWWAVIAALGAVVLVKLGVMAHVPW
jgi:hypothetical protein